jgi:hypothetical protein
MKVRSLQTYIYIQHAAACFIHTPAFLSAIPARRPYSLLHHLLPRTHPLTAARHQSACCCAEARPYVEVLGTGSRDLHPWGCRCSILRGETDDPYSSDAHPRLDVHLFRSKTTYVCMCMTTRLLAYAVLGQKRYIQLRIAVHPKINQDLIAPHLLSLYSTFTPNKFTQPLTSFPTHGRRWNATQHVCRSSTCTNI